MTYVADVTALARKDLQVELRARDTLPGDAAVRPLDARRLPLRASGRHAGRGGLRAALGRDRLHRAARALARAWVPEQEHGVLDGLVLAPCDRSAIWLGEDDRDAHLPPRGAGGGASRLSRSSSPRSTRPRSPACCSPTSASASSARSSPRWPRRAARGSFSSRCSSFRSRSRSSSAASAARSPPEGERFLLFLVLYDAVFAVLSWASFEYVVTE